MKSFRVITVLLVSLGMLIGVSGVANASETTAITPTQQLVYPLVNSDGRIIEDVQNELDYLSSLPEEEQERVLADSFRALEDERQSRVAPLIIVAAIGCAVGIGGGLFNTSWSSASSVAWSLAGVLVSCIPGTTQAGLVKIILANKGVIAKALKMAGLAAAALALGGDQ